MKKYLILSTAGVSEWKLSFVDVQDEMNRLEKLGIISNVKVQGFKNNILKQEFTYNFNGDKWIKA
jgi:hypothetical protein